jgi:hypothetical protein
VLAVALIIGLDAAVASQANFTSAIVSRAAARKRAICSALTAGSVARLTWQVSTKLRRDPGQY